MELDERTQKLQAGKEKLAAFQRKRARRKKKKETEDGASDYTWSEVSSTADLSDVASTAEFSDTGSIAGEVDHTVVPPEYSEEESDGSRHGRSQSKVSSTVALVRAKANLRKISGRVTELEEELQGKQDALSQLLEENERLRSELATSSHSDPPSDLNHSMSSVQEERGGTPDDRELTEDASQEDSYQHKLEEFERALKKRDEVITQLTENLRATTASRDTLQQEYTAQAADLARQVQTLQLQLKQAGEWLKNHMGEHGIPAQALLEAKNELLALQQVNVHKEQDLAVARAAITERDEALNAVVNQYKTAAEQANALHKEYTRLQQENTHRQLAIEQLTQANKEMQTEKTNLQQQLQSAAQRMEIAGKEEIEKLKQSLSENLGKVDALEKTVSERESDIVKLRETISQKDQSLQQMVASISNMETGGSETDSLQETAVHQQNEISKLQERIGQKDLVLQQLNEKFSKASRQLKDLYEEVSALKEKEQEMFVIRQTLQEREDTLGNLQKTVQERDEKIVVLQQTIAEQSENLGASLEKSALSDQCKHLQEEVTKLESELNQRDQSLTRMAESVNMFSEENQKLKNLESQYQHITEKNQELTQELMKVSDENTQLKQAENEIAAIASQIPVLSQEIQRLAGENKDLKEKENQMYKLVEQMKERENLVSLLKEQNEQLISKEESLFSEHAQMKFQLDSLEELQNELKHLKDSYKEQEKSLAEKEIQIKSLADLQKQHEQLQHDVINKEEENKFLIQQGRELEERLKNSGTAQLETTADGTNAIQLEEDLQLMKDVVKKKEKSIEQLSESISNLTNQVDGLKKENDLLVREKADTDALQQELSSAKKCVKEYKGESEDAQQALNKLQEEISALSIENESLKHKEDELITLKNTVTSMETKIKELETAVELKDNEMHEKSVSLVLEKDAIISELQQDLEARKAEMESLHTDIQEQTIDKAKMEEMSSSLSSQLKEMAAKLFEKDSALKELTEELRAKDSRLRDEQQTSSQLQSAVTKLQDDLDSVNTRLTDSVKTQGELEAACESKDAEIALQQQKLANLEESNSSLEKETLTLKDDVENLRAVNEELQSVDDMLKGSEKEVVVLQEAIRDRDEKLMILTDSLEKVNKELGQMSNMNELLKTREDDLIASQEGVQHHLESLNVEIFTLKEENRKLGEKEVELFAKQEELDLLRQQVKEINAEHESLKESYSVIEKANVELSEKENESSVIKSQLETLRAELRQLEEENVRLAAKDEQIQSLQDAAVSSAEEISALQQRVEKLTLSLEEAELHNGASAPALSEEQRRTQKDKLEKKRQEQQCLDSKKAIQERLDATLEENKELKERLNHLMSRQSDGERNEKETIASVNNVTIPECEQTVPLGDSIIDSSAVEGPPVEDQQEVVEVLEASTVSILEQTVPTEESEPQASMLESAIAEKNRDIQTLQQTVQGQQQSLHQMHQKLTELSQYVTYLSQENQKLKENQELNAALPVEQQHSIVAPNETQTGDKSTSNNTAEALVKEDASEAVENIPGGAHHANVESLYTYIHQQKALLDEMTSRYSVLATENQNLKSELTQRSISGIPTEGSEEQGPTGENNADQVTQATDIAALHAYIQQQSVHMEHMKAQMLQMSEYTTQLQEQNNALRERDAGNIELIQRLSQESDQLAKVNESNEDKWKRNEELQLSLARSSESLSKLDKENQMLKQKEKESSEVVQQLMKDIEQIRRSQSGTPRSSGAASPVGLMSADDLEQQMAALRAELEEQHGEQIVEMKQQLREQLTGQLAEQIKTLTEQRDDALHCLEEQSSSKDSDQVNQEEIESLQQELQQVKTSLHISEEERNALLRQMKEQKENLTLNLHKEIKHRNEIENQLDEIKASFAKDAESNRQLQAVISAQNNEHEKDTKEIEKLNNRLADVIAERDHIMEKAEELDQLKAKISSQDEERIQLKRNHDEEIQEMCSQLEQLTKERDKALSRMEMQQKEKEQSESSNKPESPDESLKGEIDILKEQLLMVTQARDEAISQLQELSDVDQKEDHVSQQPERKSTSSMLSEESGVAETPGRPRASSLQKKPLSPMQQQLLHLQQQLLRDSPPELKANREESIKTDETTPVNVSSRRDPDTMEVVETSAALQLKQMQDIYDEHCRNQAHQIEQLNAELRRTAREKEELTTQLDQYQKYYDSHVKKIVEQHQQEAAGQVKALHDEINEIKKARDEMADKLENLQSQHRAQVRDLGEQVKGWKSRYHELSQNVDSANSAAVLNAQNEALKDQLKDLQQKIDDVEKERENAKAQAKELKMAYYDLEGRDPDVASYRKRLEDMDSTLKVTWIENEELKAEMAMLKSKLAEEERSSSPEAAGESSEVDQKEAVQVRLASAEAELEKLRPLVGVEVLVLTRQLEEMRDTYAHQLRVHNQELTAVKQELARYQCLDSDSSESPAHVLPLSTSASAKNEESNRPRGAESLNIELGRAQAEHQLEVESLKKSKGEFASELNAEKERHRAAMARIEVLLKKMVKMQQKHKIELDSVEQTHSRKLHEMSLHLDELKSQSLVTGSPGMENVSEVQSHINKLISEKRQLLQEREQLVQDIKDWHSERERLKSRIAQVVGEKDLIAKECEKMSESTKNVKQMQLDLETNQRLLAAEKQQLMFDREQFKLQVEKNDEVARQQENPTSAMSHLKAELDRLRPLESEVATLLQFKEQVSYLQGEQSALIDKHKAELTALRNENTDLKQQLHEVQDDLGFEVSELKLKLEEKAEEKQRSESSVSQSENTRQLQNEIDRLKSENEDQVREFTNQAVTRLSEWKLEREQMVAEFTAKLHSAVQNEVDKAAEEASNLQTRLSEALVDGEKAVKECDAIKAQHDQLLDALRSQEAELVKLQSTCSNLKEERDTIQREHMRMFESLHQDGADTITELSQQIQQLREQRQVTREEHRDALSRLQEQYDNERVQHQQTLEEITTKHTQDLEECSARHESELNAYKQKHLEILDEVHALRRENYDMRTGLSAASSDLDQGSLQKEVLLPVLTAAPHHIRRVSTDSQSPDGDTQTEKNLTRVCEEYEEKLRELDQSHRRDLEEKEEQLSEQYDLSLRKLKVEHQFDLQNEVKKIKQDSERETERQLKVARIENERKFVEELQKVRQELSERHDSQIETLRKQYEQGALHQVTGESPHQLEDVIARLQIQNQELVEARTSLLQQIDKSHGHQEELQEELTAVSSQKDGLIAENLQLRHTLTLSSASQRQSPDSVDPNRHPVLEEEILQAQSVPKLEAATPTGEGQLYSEVPREDNRLQEKLSGKPPSGFPEESVSCTESSVESADKVDASGEHLKQQLLNLQEENSNLRGQLDDHNLAVQLGELQGKYIQLVAENETLRAQLQGYIQEDSLEDIAVGAEEGLDLQRMRSKYTTIAEENEVLRAKLGSYGLPTESVAEEESLDLPSRYELIMKENEKLRTKLHAYSQHGSVERDSHWKEKYDAILRDYARLRAQLEGLGLPIDDSIQKGLEELQVKFDQVVKEKETLQGKLATVRENAEQDFRELQCRHSELNDGYTVLTKDHAELKALMEKDKDKSKREYVKIKNKVSNLTKEHEVVKTKLNNASKETEELKAKLAQAESRLKQFGSTSAVQQATSSKGKKRKQERTSHGKGCKQRRESETLDDSMDMSEQSMEEEFDSLKSQYVTVVKENESLKSEVGGLKCELGSLKARLMDSLRHRLRDPPVAHSTPLDNMQSDTQSAVGKQSGATPTGKPHTEKSQRRKRKKGALASCPTSDLDLSSPEGVEALRVQHEATLQELSELRNELDRMNSKALDELMGLQNEADALEEENTSMIQALNIDTVGANAHSLSDINGSALQDEIHSESKLYQRCKEVEQQLILLKKQFQEVTSENDELRNIIGVAADSDQRLDVNNKDYVGFKEGLDSLGLSRRIVHSDSEIRPLTEKGQVNAASAELLPREKPKRTVSFGSVDVEGVPVDQLTFDVDPENHQSFQKRKNLNTAIPRSGLEGGQSGVEWQRLLTVQSNVPNTDDKIVEEGFHPEVETNSAEENKQGGNFVPDSPNVLAQIAWSSVRSSSTELHLMPIEEEFKMQLEAMVANFGEENVREQLGRDYVEIHQKCEAMRETIEGLQTEAKAKEERLIELSLHIAELEQYKPSTQKESLHSEGKELLANDELPEDSALVRLTEQLEKLKDQNALLLQENSTLEFRCQSQSAKSAWQETVVKGDLENELEHLRKDRVDLEEEVAKIRGLYMDMKERSDHLACQNEELAGEKSGLQRELQVLRSLLETLKQEQVKVDHEIEEKISTQALQSGPHEEGSGDRLDVNLAESSSSGKMSQKKSVSTSDLQEGVQGGKGGKKGKKSASPTPDLTKKGAVPSRAASGKDSSRGASPMKAVKEPPMKVKKVSQSHLSASKESVASEEKVGLSQLKQKVKELTAKNKALQAEVDGLKKNLTAADKSREMTNLQKQNKTLLQEIEDLRASLQNQDKLMEQLQDLRSRIEALTREKDMLKKENQVLSDRINDEVSPPMMEFEDLKVQNQQLLKDNQSLMEKLDRDLMQAERELLNMRDRFSLVQAQKEEIEEEYKTCKDRLEKELYNIQSRLDEITEERDFLETQLINTREHAEKDYRQLQAVNEEMRNEFEELQKAYDNQTERSRKELSEVKAKLECAKQDNEELKREIVNSVECTERERSALQHQCALLQEDKHNLTREIKDYQNRLNGLEKTKEETEKQLRELRSHCEHLQKYHEEEKGSFEEQNDFLHNKVNTLKRDYDALSETLEELKLEKMSLSHELNDSHAWCETLEMNLKETESTMHKETVTLKEELRFVSEKLENETSVRNTLASAEEELRQKLISTAQELDRVKQEALVNKEKLKARVDQLQEEKDDTFAQLQVIQEKLSQSEKEKEACNAELSTVRETHEALSTELQDLKKEKNSIENEYAHMRNKFGVTESHLVEFRKSVLTENVESEKLLSKFRVQFEQVTKERDNLQSERNQWMQEVEELKANISNQKRENELLRQAMGTEVDTQSQSVHHLKTLLGDSCPPSLTSPLCCSPAHSETSSEDDFNPDSEELLGKLHKQNESLAELIQELANIKVAKEKEMADVTARCESLQELLNESQSYYSRRDSSQLEADLELLRSQNEELHYRAQETESELQQMVKRCRILEEELLRLQRNPGSVGSSSSHTSKEIQKYVVEMEDDLLTVSTVTVAAEDDSEQPNQEQKPDSPVGAAMICSPHLSSSSVLSLSGESPHSKHLVRSSTDPELARLKDKTWQSEYLALQDKYMQLLKEHEKIWQRLRQSPTYGEGTDLTGQLTIEVTDGAIIDLIEENSRLQADRTRLENEILSQRIDCLEVDAAYTELSWLKEQKVKLEEKLKLQHHMYEREKEMLEQRLNQLQASLDQLLAMKSKSEEEAQTLKLKYSELLALSSSEAKELAQQGSSDKEREKLILMVAEKERIAELENQVKCESDEKALLQLQVSHLKKECELYDRHVSDLEKEIAAQYSHLHEASREHKTMVQLLAETKLELGLSRHKHEQVMKIGKTVEQIEAQLSGRSTPLLHSPPSASTSGTSSPQTLPAVLEKHGGANDDSPGKTSEEIESEVTGEDKRAQDTSRIVQEMVQLRQQLVHVRALYCQPSPRQSPAAACSHNYAAIKEELAAIEEQNTLLKTENDQLQKQLSDQEELLFHLQARLGSDSTDEGKDTLEAVLTQQVTLLQSQRDTLHTKLEKTNRQCLEACRDKTHMEEMFNQEKQALFNQLRASEAREQELVQKVAALERHIREQQRLDELLYTKSSLEEEMRRQRQTFDHELLGLEKSLHERRSHIRTERVRLLGELKQKHWSQVLSKEVGDGSGGGEGQEEVPEAHYREKSPRQLAAGMERLSRIKADVERHYREAIERLREELNADYGRVPPKGTASQLYQQ